MTRPLAITSRQIRSAIKAGKAEGMDAIDVKIGDVVIRYIPADPEKKLDTVDGEKNWHL